MISIFLKIHFLKTDKMLPVESCQKTKVFLDSSARQSRGVLYLFQCTSSMHKPMYTCPQKMSILVCDGNEVTRALDMSVSSNILNRSFT